jgi:transposase
MMGTKERIFAPLRDVSIEDLVPRDHFYRHLDRLLDLSFVRDLVKDYYSHIGRPSIDPVVFFRLQLCMFFEGIRSERQLMRVVADRLSIRWYLGYDLHEPLPDHSSLARIRERYGLEAFARFFEEIVERCIEAGLVWGRELYFDATKVEANASLDSMMPRFAVEAHLENLFSPEQANPPVGHDFAPEQTNLQDGHDGAPQPLHSDLPEAVLKELSVANSRRHDWIEGEGAQNREVVTEDYQRLSDLKASPTDPDASLMRRTNGKPDLGYHTNYVVDGGKARIVLHALVTPAEVMDNQPMLDLLWRTRFRWKLWPHQVTGDSKYGTVPNIAAIEREGIHAYVSLADYDSHKPFFGKLEFHYDPERDAYVCPRGEDLPFRYFVHRYNAAFYRANADTCNTCPLKAQCTESDKGRTLRRKLDEVYVDRVRAYQETEAYQKAIRKRSVWVEPLFGEGKQWHGMGRFRLRRLKRVNIEAQLIAAGQNLKRLLSRRGWGGRHFPGGAAGVAVAPFPLCP